MTRKQYFIASRPLKSSKTRYFTIKTKNGTSRYISFYTRNDAQLFKDYLLNYHLQYGKWPNIDSSNNINHTIINLEKSSNTICHPIFIIGWNIELINNTSKKFCINTVMIQSFEYNNGKLNMKLYDDSVDYDLSIYRFKLENLLK